MTSYVTYVVSLGLFYFWWVNLLSFYVLELQIIEKLVHNHLLQECLKRGKHFVFIINLFLLTSLTYEFIFLHILIFIFFFLEMRGWSVEIQAHYPVWMTSLTWGEF